MAEERDLPGWPKKRLVKLVRAQLWRYGIRPRGRPWRAAWSWAHAIAISYVYTQWPTASEISTQYLLLLLKLHPHLLRHTMAHQFLADNQNDLVSLAQILGHENLNTTARYTKRTQDQLGEAADRLSY